MSQQKAEQQAVASVEVDDGVFDPLKILSDLRGGVGGLRYTSVDAAQQQHDNEPLPPPSQAARPRGQRLRTPPKILKRSSSPSPRNSDVSALQNKVKALTLENNELKSKMEKIEVDCKSKVKKSNDTVARLRVQIAKLVQQVERERVEREKFHHEHSAWSAKVHAEGGGKKVANKAVANNREKNHVPHFMTETGHVKPVLRKPTKKIASNGVSSVVEVDLTDFAIANSNHNYTPKSRFFESGVPTFDVSFSL